MILGDILAILLGSGIAFKGKHDFLVDEWTTLIVMSIDSHQSHKTRNDFLSNQINSLNSVLNTPDGIIGKIIVDSFTDEESLREKLREYVVKAIACYHTEISTAINN